MPDLEIRRQRHAENATNINMNRRVAYENTSPNEKRTLLKKQRDDRAKCPICDRGYRRRYLRLHMQSRH